MEITWSGLAILTHFLTHFLVADTQLYKRLCPSIGRKTRISALAHPSATGIGRVSGLVLNIKL